MSSQNTYPYHFFVSIDTQTYHHQLKSRSFGYSLFPQVNPNSGILGLHSIVDIVVVCCHQLCVSQPAIGVDKLYQCMATIHVFLCSHTVQQVHPGRGLSHSAHTYSPPQKMQSFRKRKQVIPPEETSLSAMVTCFLWLYRLTRMS